jgi:starch phosphorylase
VQEVFSSSPCLAGESGASIPQEQRRWEQRLPDEGGDQLNDTHPSMSVPELMRILLDEAKLDWDQAWDITQRTLAYTNHTLLPEALEKWPVEWFEMLLPRQLEIIYEINRGFSIRCGRIPGDEGRVAARQPDRRRASSSSAWRTSRSSARTAPTASRRFTSSCCARRRSETWRRFSRALHNKTNGVTPRRWLLLCNPALAEGITTRSATLDQISISSESEGLAAEQRFRDRSPGQTHCESRSSPTGSAQRADRS